MKALLVILLAVSGSVHAATSVDPAVSENSPTLEANSCAPVAARLTEVEAQTGANAPVSALEEAGPCTPTFCAARESICEAKCTCPLGDGVKNFHCETINGRCTVTCRCYPPTSCPI